MCLRGIREPDGYVTTNVSRFCRICSSEGGRCRSYRVAYARINLLFNFGMAFTTRIPVLKI